MNESYPLHRKVCVLKLSRVARKRGSAIVGAFLVVAIVTGLVGVSFLATNGAARMSGRSRDYVGVQRAAEASVEYGFGVWKQRVYGAGRPITTTEASAGLTGPSLPGFTYASIADNGPLAISATDEYGAPAESSHHSDHGPLPPALIEQMPTGHDIEGARNGTGQMPQRHGIAAPRMVCHNQNAVSRRNRCT